MKEKLTEDEKKQFVAESNALFQKIKSFKRHLRISIFLMLFLFGNAVFDIIKAFTMRGDTITLEYIALQNDFYFTVLLLFMFAIHHTWLFTKVAEKLSQEINEINERYS